MDKPPIVRPGGKNPVEMLRLYCGYGCGDLLAYVRCYFNPPGGYSFHFAYKLGRFFCNPDRDAVTRWLSLAQKGRYDHRRRAHRVNEAALRRVMNHTSSFDLDPALREKTDRLPLGDIIRPGAPITMIHYTEGELDDPVYDHVYRVACSHCGEITTINPADYKNLTISAV